MRGVGFLVPCDLNSDSLVSRGTTSTLTGRPSRFAKAAAISLAVTRCGPGGRRKIGITPFLVTEATSQAEFSMNHPGRRKAIGNDNSLRACSMIVCCESRFEWVAWAPIVDRYTTLPGRAASSAELNVAAVVRASRKSGDGSKLGGTSTNTPSDPLNAAVSAAASLTHAFEDPDWYSEKNPK